MLIGFGKYKKPIDFGFTSQKFKVTHKGHFCKKKLIMFSAYVL